MRTQYIKNFPTDSYQKILNHFVTMATTRTPIWAGTIQVGPQQIYVHCHIPELAKQIPDWFISTTQNAPISPNIPHLYLFDGDKSELLNRPAQCDICQIFCDTQIVGTPDIIAAHNFTFVQDKNRMFFMGLKYDINSDIKLVMGENHILMRHIKHLLENTNTYMFHGAAIGYDNYGVMISGLSGAGKSTLAAQCLTMGLDYVGDDRIAITKTDNEIIANPIYTTISFKNSAPDFPARFISKNYTKEKNIYRFNKDFNFRYNLPIRAIISPKKANNVLPRIVRGNKTDIITHIVIDYSNSANIVHSPNPLLDFTKIEKLFENCDFYDFELGADISENSKFLYNFITKRMKNVHQE